MPALFAVLIAGLLAFEPGIAVADPGAVAAGPAAYQQTLPDLSGDALALFHQGAGIFHQAWVVGTSTDTPRFTGLGPLFNRRSCIACHTANGRGETSQGPNDGMRSTLIRLSVPGPGEHRAPRPEPTYGDQLQSEGVIGVAGEGQAALRWQEQTVRLKDGTPVDLRRPELVIRDLGYGPLSKDTLFSVRMAPPVFGLGLLEAVPEEELSALARRAKPKGVKGHLNYVWDVEHRRMAAGRFGLKANQPTIKQQVAAALNGDMGITSSVFPQQNCTLPETACSSAPQGRQPEISDADLTALVAHIADLAPPPKRGGDASVSAGEKLFKTIGCAACHVQSLRIGDLGGDRGQKTIHPYTDLLLHDLGAGLADHRPDFQAGGREWRTTPLWGIGLAEVVADGPVTYLHDGRARNLTEAILWHDGEAKTAREAFATLPKPARGELLSFLNNL